MTAAARTTVSTGRAKARRVNITGTVRSSTADALLRNCRTSGALTSRRYGCSMSESAATHRRMLRARDAMDRDFAGQLDIAALASIACVSQANFIRSFKASFGETPHRYLQRRRIERAMYLLRTTDTAVTSVLHLRVRQPRHLQPHVRQRRRCHPVTVPPRSTGRRSADLLREEVDAAEQFRRSPGHHVTRTLTAMLRSINRSQLFVTDQDLALDFYVNTLGLQLAADVDLGFMRWLTVCVPAEPDREILLERIGAPAMDDDTAAQARELLAKGALGGWLCITTDDANATFAALKARGVDITDEPSPKPYGIDFGIRDPFGNAIRIGQLFDPTGA